ncbi:MAG: hypothetical protein LAP85_09315 [Acidobacteriia bacterium]|nr:hypothetical protein [Terriglobia bacterium]
MRAILHPNLNRQRLSRAAIVVAILIVAGAVAPLSALSGKIPAAVRTPQTAEALTEVAEMAKASEAENLRQEAGWTLKRPAPLVTSQDGARPKREAAPQDASEMQARLGQLRVALRAHSAAIARYSTGLIRGAQLAEISRVLAEQIAAIQKVTDTRIPKAYAELTSQKAELEEKLKPLNESDSNSWAMMRQRVEIERLIGAYGQLLWRKATLEMEINSLLRRYQSNHPDVGRKQAELESVIRELETILK